MIRDLPKHIPVAARMAIETAATACTRLAENRSLAWDAHSAHFALARDERGADKLRVMAEHLIDWGADISQSDPFKTFATRFRTAGQTVSLSLLNQEFKLGARETVPESTIKAELTLELDPQEVLPFRYFLCYDDHMLYGGGLLRTGDAIFRTVFPSVLSTLHNQIAEGDVWDRVIYALKKYPGTL